MEQAKTLVGGKGRAQAAASENFDVLKEKNQRGRRGEAPEGISKRGRKLSRATLSVGKPRGAHRRLKDRATGEEKDDEGTIHGKRKLAHMTTLP